MKLKWLLLLITGQAEKIISAEYDLNTLGTRSQIKGIWKLSLDRNKKVDFKAFTYRQKNFIETKCDEYNVKLWVFRAWTSGSAHFWKVCETKIFRLLQYGSPSLPVSYYENEFPALFNASAPVLNETLTLTEIPKDSNVTNEVFTEFLPKSTRKTSQHFKGAVLNFILTMKWAITPNSS